MKKLLSSIGTVFFALLACFIITSHAQAVDSPAKLASFQVGGYMSLATADDSISANIAWTPIFEVGPIGIRGELGATLLDLPILGSYVVTNYEVLARLPLMPLFTFEAGGGLQTAHISGASSTDFVLTGGIALGLAGVIDRVYATYSRVFDADANLIKVGIGLVF